MSAPSFEALVRRLAVSGRFDPIALFADIPEAEAQTMTARLARLCEEEISENAYAWVLRAAARREALAWFDNRDEIKRVIAQAPKVGPGDQFGEMLRAALQGRLAAGRTVAARAAADDARQAALQFASCVPALSEREISTDLEDTRMRIALRERDDALDIVLARNAKLYGREQPRRRINEFVSDRTQDIRPLLVAGLGGVGKSALIAALVRSWKRRSNSPLVILLDFDRPALSAGDPIEIVREFTRQLGFEWHRGGSADRDARDRAQGIMQDMRRQLRATRQSAGEVIRIHAEEQFSLLQSLVFYPLKAELPAELRESTIIMIMDTFEAVGIRGPEVINRVLDVEASLREISGFSRLRTIVSGRGVPLPEDIAIQRFGEKTRWIEIGGLATEPAAAFLESRDQSGKFRAKSLRIDAARALDGHPLALIVLERYARERSAGEVADLLRDIRDDPAFSAEFAQVFLYSRILERIGDNDVRALAHPGLVLRYVTPDLIRLVLAEPCGLGKVSVDRSWELFAKLKREYWLVDIVNDNLVRHRPDLRRLMLSGLFAAPRSTDTQLATDEKAKRRAAAMAVSRAAAAYYRDGPPSNDPGLDYWSSLGPNRRRAQEFYHKALAGTKAPQNLSSELAALVRSELGEDLETMPLAWRAVVKAAVGEALTMTDGEIGTLRGSLRDTAEKARIEADLQQGETARGLLRSRSEQARKRAARSKATKRPVGDLGLIGSEVLAAFDEADIDAVVEVGSPLLHRYLEGDISESVRKIAVIGRLWETDIWKILISTAAIKKIIIHIDVKFIDMIQWPLLYFSDSLTSGKFAANLIKYNFVSLDGARFFSAATARRDPKLPGVIPANALALGGPWVWSGKSVRRNQDGYEAFMKSAVPAPRPGYWARTLGLEFGPKVLSFISGEYGRRSGLKGLEQIYQEGETVKILPPTNRESLPELLAILRGLTPELHQPARRLLTTLPQSAAIDLARELSSRSPFWPAELLFDKSNSNQYTVRHALPLIESADRCGLLYFALQFLGEHDVRAKRLVAIHDVITDRLFTYQTAASRKSRLK